MTITTKNKRIDTASLNYLFIQGEKNVDYVTFELDDKVYKDIDLTLLTYILRATTSSVVEQTLAMTVDDDVITLTWEITDDFTAVAGPMSIEIRGISEDDTEIIKFQSNSFNIRKGSSPGTPPPPDIFDKMLDDINSLQTGGGDKLSYTVGTGGINAYQVAFISSANTVMAANSENTTHAGRIVGIAKTSKTAGQTVECQTYGIINNTSWALTPSAIYYLGAGGEITSTVPEVGFVQKIGVAQSTTKLFIQIEAPIILN